MENREIASRVGPRTEKAMKKVEMKGGIFSGGNKTPEFAADAVKDFANLDRGILYVPGGNYEPDGDQINLRSSVIEDVIESTENNRLSASRAVIAELSSQSGVHSLGYDRETGEIFEKPMEVSDEYGMVDLEFGSDGEVTKVNFDLGDGMGDIYFADQFVTGVKRDELMVLTAVVRHNQRLKNGGYFHPQPTISSGEMKMFYAAKGMAPVWEAMDK